MSRFLPLLLAGILFASLSACGQKGDLYLSDTQHNTPDKNDQAK